MLKTINFETTLNTTEKRRNLLLNLKHYHFFIIGFKNKTLLFKTT